MSNSPHVHLLYPLPLCMESSKIKYNSKGSEAALKHGSYQALQNKPLLTHKKHNHLLSIQQGSSRNGSSKQQEFKQVS